MIPGIVPIVAAGAPLEDPEITSLYFLGQPTGATFTITGLDWGDEPLAPNKRSIVVTAVIISTRDISGTPTINGQSATVVYNDVTPTVASQAYRFLCFTLDLPTGSTGDVSFNITGSALNVFVGVYRCINLDTSAVVDSTIDAAAGSATLSIDCGEDGGVLTQGFYAYSGGSTPTSADFANLATLEFIDSSLGGTLSAQIFASVQTGLNVSYDPTPDTNITRSHAYALAFDYAF